MAAMATEIPALETPVYNDPCTDANFNEVNVLATSFDWRVDFATKTITGLTRLTCVSRKDALNQIILDAKDLTISQVQVITQEGKTPATFVSRPTRIEAFGQPLEITLTNPFANEAKFDLEIEYSTSPHAHAIQWLAPSQTAGKEFPYLFTQCQPILARTLCPCQDSPGCKNPYSARVRVKKPFVALMSALQDGSEEDGDEIVYKFNQPVPTPSYLICLAVGQLEKRDISPRCAVWSEPSTVDAAAWEFANTEESLQIAESICGEFVWGRYDMLLLPPSFPYGGMENPNLTFLTPTLIAGDRSLENVVAHEITHSWTGNLVTNCSWENFWLNEGFTKFIEMRIGGKKLGKEYEKLLQVNGRHDLQAAVDRFGADHEFTKLNLSLVDTDPDDAFSSIPYEKGAEFLFYLEKLVGGPDIFEPYLKHHMDTWKFKSFDSEQFKQTFLGYFADKVSQQILETIDWEKWLRAPGMPELDTLESQLIKDVDDLLQKWGDEAYAPTADDMTGFHVPQLEMFLDKMKIQFDEAVGNGVDKAVLRRKLDRIAGAYQFDDTKNAEIRFRVALLALACDDEPRYRHAVELLETVGRMKFVRPLFRAMAKGERKQLALETFTRTRENYHPICAKMVAQDLEVQ